MKIPLPLPIPNRGCFTAFVHSDCIHVLCRSSDWYGLPPLQRYLYNMAASNIYLEDARTETRVYTFERYDHLRRLIDRTTGEEWQVAYEAWFTWYRDEMDFGVVHLDLEEGKRGNLLLGDDPEDFSHWLPDDGNEGHLTEEIVNALLPGRGHV